MKPTRLIWTAVLVGIVSCGEGANRPDPAAAGEGGGSGSSVGGSGGRAGSSGALPAGAPATAGSSGTAGEGESGAESGGAGGEAGSDGMPEPDLTIELFDPANVPHFELELSPEAMSALDADPDTYVRGTFRYGDEVVSDVGVRLKGEGSFRPLARKAAFKLKFDEFVSKQAFRGLRRLTLNNMVEDPSFLAERLAYEFFRFAGLPAPRCNSATVSVNGAAYGVYAHVETEDKTFLRRWFASDGGNLYEEGQVDFTPGAEAMFDLETNETLNDRSDLANLIAVFQTAQPDTFLSDLDAALDTEHFLRFTAAEAAVNQWDMYAYTVFYPNNFRLYHDPTSAKFVFLPWGMDMSMKPFRDTGKPHVPVLELARRGTFMSSPITTGLLFRRCLESASCRATYIDVVRDVIARFETAKLEDAARRYYEQIHDAVAEDPRKEYSLAQFETGYTSLLRTIQERPDAMRASIGD